MSFRDIHPNAKIRLLTQFLTTLASTMVIPFVAIYFASKVGETITGLMVIAVTISGVAGGLIGGFYADRLGRRKLMLLSEAAVSITYFLIALANSPWLDSPYLTFAFFVVNLFFGGLFIPASQAMVLDVSSYEQRKLFFFLMYWLNNFAIALGGIAGAFLFKTMRFELFLAVSGVALFSFLMTVFFIVETYRPAPAAEKQRGFFSMFASYRQVCKDGPFMLFILASVLIASLEQQLNNYIGIRMEKEMAIQPLIPGVPLLPSVDGIKMLGLLKTENTVLVVVCGAFMTALFRRFPDRPILFSGLAIFTLGFAVLGVSNTPWILLSAMLLATIGELLYVPIKQAFLGELAPDHARSSYMAVFSLTQYGAMIIGAVCISLGGFLSSWTMCALLLLMGSVGIGAMARMLTALQRKKGVQPQAESNQAMRT